MSASCGDGQRGTWGLLEVGIFSPFACVKFFSPLFPPSFSVPLLPISLLITDFHSCKSLLIFFLGVNTVYSLAKIYLWLLLVVEH